MNENKKLDELPFEIKKKIDHYQGLHNDVSKQITTNLDDEEEMTQKINDLQKKSASLNKDREIKINEITRIDSNLENLKIKEKELREIIFQRSRINPEELEKNLKEKRIELSDYENIKVKLDRLISQREQMGPVNLRAKIEEKIVDQSIDELEMEKLDLSQAIDKLRIAINKINSEGKNRLLKAYEEVNKIFSDLFKKLFNRGEAKLELVKSDDPLQTGIEIYADHLVKNYPQLVCSQEEKSINGYFINFLYFLNKPITHLHFR